MSNHEHPTYTVVIPRFEDFFHSYLALIRSGMCEICTGCAKYVHMPPFPALEKSYNDAIQLTVSAS